MEGRDITESILFEARKKADEIINAAQDNKAETLAKAKEILDAKREEVLSNIDLECKQIVDRRVMLAKLDAGKTVLGQKQQLIESVYADAADEIIRFNDEKYRDFISGIVCQYAEDGDELIISSADSDRLDAGWFDAVCKKVNKNLTFSNERHFDKGGIILRGKKYDKKLTLTALIEEVRLSTEQEVINKLFG